MKSECIQKRLISSRNKAVMRILGRHMISVRECAGLNGVSIWLIHKLLRLDRIPGAYKIDTGKTGLWLIPAEWVHKRKKKGKHKKTLMKHNE